MDRTDWLKHVQVMTERLYDRVSPQYWVTFGFYPNETHLEFIHKFLEGLEPHRFLLSAACGAGRYDGLLLEAGHHLLGVDQSIGMLERARSRFPVAEYEKIGLEKLDFLERFDGAICVDALEHLPPEEWPQVMKNFSRALKPDTCLYFTVEQAQPEELDFAYAQGKAMGLPVVYGEVAYELELAYQQFMQPGTEIVPGALAARAAYHYYPSNEQVNEWIRLSGFRIQESGIGNDYKHILVRKLGSG